MAGQLMGCGVTYDEAVGIHLKILRQQVGLKQNEVAEMMGVTPSTWSLKEAGKCATTTAQIMAFADLLSIRPGFVLNQAADLLKGGVA